MKLFRFLSNQSSRYAYAGLIDNEEKALSRCFFGMARDGRALNIGGRVKGAFPLVFICPLHINNKNN